jgi:hypothetical protein
MPHQGRDKRPAKEGANMKNLTTRIMIAAAALVAAASVASAQTMEANIPFAFRADGKVLAAGTYRVDMVRTGSGNVVVAIRGLKKDQQVLSTSQPDGEAKETWKSTGKAILSFRCGVSRCALTEIWTGGDSLQYRLPTPSLGKDEPVHTAEIAMHAVKGD